MTGMEPVPGKPVSKVFRAWVEMSVALDILGAREDRND